MKSRSLAIASWLSAIFIIGCLMAIVVDILWQGLAGISLEFILSEPMHSGRAGGIAPILMSTFLIILIAMLASIPLGLGTAVWLSEMASHRNSFAGIVRKSLDILSGVPSIVFGLFGNAFFCVYLKMGFSILSGGLTLACMALPLFIRVAEEALRSVPRDYRVQSMALGFTKIQTLFFIVLPVALPGIVSAGLLGFGRAIAETAALIFTSGYVDRWPDSVMDSGRSLSIHIYDLAMNVPGGDQKAFASSLTLLGILLFVGAMSAVLMGRHLKRKGFGYGTGTL